MLANSNGYIASKFLKTDTDGFDGKLLRGGIDFLGQSSPVIFFEYDPDLLAVQGDSWHDLLKYVNDVA